MDSLKRASKPTKDEVDRLKELGKITTAEEKEIDKLTQGSKQLKDKVKFILVLCFSTVIFQEFVVSSILSI